MTNIISAGDTVPFVITFKDTNGAVVNLATMTAIKFHFIGPKGAVAIKTPAHVTNGTDGKETWTSAVTDFIYPGYWVLEGYYTDGTIVKRSITDFSFYVREIVG